MRNAKAQSWVVYSMLQRHNIVPLRCVCEQAEWEAMEQAKPGFYSLIQSGIENEGEAERLARGNSGEARSRTTKQITATWPHESAAAPVGDTSADN